MSICPIVSVDFEVLDQGSVHEHVVELLALIVEWYAALQHSCFSERACQHQPVLDCPVSNTLSSAVLRTQCVPSHEFGVNVRAFRSCRLGRRSLLPSVPLLSKLPPTNKCVSAFLHLPVRFWSSEVFLLYVSPAWEVD